MIHGNDMSRLNVILGTGLVRHVPDAAILEVSGWDDRFVVLDRRGDSERGKYRDARKPHRRVGEMDT